jgi:DtxR family Mn-dependent transcriptional regulator
VHPEFQAQPKDEILEQVWCRREDGDESISGLLRDTREEGASELLRALEQDGLVRLGDDQVLLTEPGEARARRIVRCHRLAERLLFEVLDLPAGEIEKTACLMEHVLSPAAADAVCSFLGHPPRCPEGRDIPPGDCCRSRDERQLQPLVVPLDELPRGGEGRIAFMTPRYQKRFDRLGVFGVVPGNRIRLKQTQPSVVIEIDGTSLALDRDIAREIYVRRES